MAGILAGLLVDRLILFVLNPSGDYTAGDGMMVLALATFLVPIGITLGAVSASVIVRKAKQRV